MRRQEVTWWTESARSSIILPPRRAGPDGRAAASFGRRPNSPTCLGIRPLKIGVEHKKRVEAWFAEIFSENGVSEPARIARQVSLLIDGAFSQAMLYRDPTYFREAGLAAQALVRSALSNSSAAAT